MKILLYCLLIKTVFLSWSWAAIAPFSASPDQVLVLYNADYVVDTDGSFKGQDSKEVAEYYVKMYTDPITGKKPYLLGLKCKHDKKHLNDWFIREDSNDNKNGVVFTGEGKGPGEKEWARDSRKVEINIIPGKENIDWESITITVQALNGETKQVTEYTVSGSPVKKNRKIIYPEIEKSAGRCYRFNAQNLFSGTVKVFVSAKKIDGKTAKKISVTYWDIREFKPSIKGKDGVIDEKNFQEDVAIPVKAFLENSKNQLPDGMMLKDHILYMVVCHGLPFSCKGVFGIQRGVTENPNDHGSLGSLEQRLQTLYYGWGIKIVPPVISRFMRGGPGKDDGVRNYKITSSLSFPLTGRHWNPHMHPDTYSFLSKNKRVPRFLQFPALGQERKTTEPYLFAYGVSRIDGNGPREAKRLIDYSLYASKYLRPEMIDKEQKYNLRFQLKEAEVKNLWGKEELMTLGFPIVSKHNKKGIPFLKRKVEGKYSTFNGNKELHYSGYWPGGIDRTVTSGNGWNMGRSAPIWKQIDQGVTISACGGPAYGEGPHITNATFWDNRILMHYLFRGRDLGECFLRSTLYVNWATSLIGDPLYHPDLNQTIVDTIAPEIDSRDDIFIDVFPVKGKFSAYLKVTLKSTKAKPEVCFLKVYYSKEGDTTRRESIWPLYSTQPHVVLRDLDPDSVYFCQVVLTDPYGNSTDLSETFGLIQIMTGPSKSAKPIARVAKKGKKGWEIDCLRLTGVYEKATMEIEFLAGIQGLVPSIDSKSIKVKAVKWPDKKSINISYELGGPKKRGMIVSPLIKGEKATLVVRWRKFPITREIILRAKDGSEFTIAADVRTPWAKIKPDLRIKIGHRDGVKILSGKIINDSIPASKEAFGLEVRAVDKDLWEIANR